MFGLEFFHKLGRKEILNQRGEADEDAWRLSFRFSQDVKSERDFAKRDCLARSFTDGVLKLADQCFTFHFHNVEK